MPPGLENPFRPPHEPTLTDAQAVGKVLGSADQKAMEAVLGEEALGPQEDLPKEILSRGEREVLERAEAERPWTRQQYINWAEEFDLGDAEWVDTNFTFQKDGTTSANKYLHLDGKGLNRLPRGLVEVHGGLFLSKNKFTSLEGFPQTIAGSLYLDGNPLASLHGLPKNIQGDLCLRWIAATDFPEGIHVQGKILLKRRLQPELAKYLRSKNYKISRS